MTIKYSKTHIQRFVLFVICCYLVVTGHCSGFYPDALGLGGIASIGGGDDGGLGTVPPAGSRGRAPGQGVWGEAGSFLLCK